MKLLKVIFEISHQLLQHTSLSAKDLEEIKKRNVAQDLVKEIIKKDLIKIKLVENQSSTSDRLINTYSAECYIQTVEECNETIRALKHLEATIAGLTSANTQEILLQQLDKLKETLK